MLDYIQARYYSPQQGRFVSVEPQNAGAALANPQTWNAYAYVGNNPLNYADPTGESLWSWLGIGLRIASAIFTGPIGAALVGAGASHTIGTVALIGASVVNGPNLAGNAVGGLGGCGGPLGNCGSLGVGPWSEMTGLGTVRDPGRFIFDAEPRTGNTPLGSGWSASVDAFWGGEGIEIHVFKGTKEMGILSGRLGWIAKHGKEAVRPAGMPDSVVNALNGLNISVLRRQGRLPGTFRGFRYLNAGRLLGVLPSVTMILDEILASKDLRGACADGRAMGHPGWVNSTMGPVYVPTLCANAGGTMF